MRAFEELKECNFENLTFGEFSEYDLDCKEHCPFYEDACPVANGYPNNSADPPCCIYDSNDIMEDKYNEEEERKLHIWLKTAEEKQKMNEYYKRNALDLAEIRTLKKLINREYDYLATIRSVKSFFTSRNIASAMIGKDKMYNPQNENISTFDEDEKRCLDRIKKYKLEIEDIKSKLK